MIRNVAMIYRDITQLVYDVMDMIDNLPKKYKYILGDRLMSKGIDCIQSIVLYHKNNKTEEYERLFVNNYQLFRVLMRIAEEKKLWSVKQISHLALIVSRIENNING